MTRATHARVGNLGGRCTGELYKADGLSPPRAGEWSCRGLEAEVVAHPSVVICNRWRSLVQFAAASAARANAQSHVGLPRGSGRCPST